MTEYNFVTIWRFDTSVERVYDALYDADNYHLWWKGQSKVETIQKGDVLGVGAIKRFRTRSFLPYSLVYEGTVTAVEPLKKIEGRTQGDLQGHGIWLFEGMNGFSSARYIWNVHTNSQWMNLLTPVARPFFKWNHDVVMRWGGEGLAKYLQCRLLD